MTLKNIQDGQRGFLNAKAINLSRKFLGEEMTLGELRLLPYIDFCIKNGGQMDLRKINEAENNILDNWVELEYMVIVSGSRIFISRKFYDFMQAILAECYVNFAEFKKEKSWYIFSKFDNMWYMGKNKYTDNILSAKIYKTTHGAISGLRTAEKSKMGVDLIIVDENGKELMF